MTRCLVPSGDFYIWAMADVDNVCALRTYMLTPPRLRTPSWQVKLVFHPLPYGSRPIMMAFTMPKDSLVKDLKTKICESVNAAVGKANALETLSR